MFFKNRAIMVKMEKAKKTTPSDSPPVERTLEDKAEAILSIVEGVAIKVFCGFCVYIALDTARQVAVAKSTNPRDE